MSKRLKQASLFFDADHSMSSEVVDNLYFLSPTSVHSTATMRDWMKKTTNATLVLVKGNWFRLLFSRFTVETVHIFVSAPRKCGRSFIGSFLLGLFSVMYPFFPFSVELFRQWTREVVFLCYFVHRNARFFSPANFELRITICWVF